MKKRTDVRGLNNQIKGEGVKNDGKKSEELW
jgi:hypothetical protein